MEAMPFRAADESVMRVVLNKHGLGAANLLTGQLHVLAGHVSNVPQFLIKEKNKQKKTLHIVQYYVP